MRRRSETNDQSPRTKELPVLALPVDSTGELDLSPPTEELDPTASAPAGEADPTHEQPRTEPPPPASERVPERAPGRAPDQEHAEASGQEPPHPRAAAASAPSMPTEALNAAPAPPPGASPPASPAARPTGGHPGGPPGAAPHGGPPAGPPGSPADPARPRWVRLVLAVLAVAVLIGVGVGGFAAGRRGDGGPAGGAAPAAAGAAAGEDVQATVSSVDPVGGSGLRRTGSGADTVWSTQTYASESFGNLKPGVGLVLDLGSPRELAAVSLDARTGPLTIELRASDALPSGADGTQVVGDPVTADGPTTLPAEQGGEHRYWMVWVTGLAPSDGGWSASLTTPVARG